MRDVLHVLAVLLFTIVSSPGTFAATVEAPPVQVQIDWQAHPAMHIPWKMFGRGLTDRRLRHRTWRHMFRQTVSAPALKGSGVRIFLAAAMAAERARNPKQARRLILKQFAYVESFIEQNSEQYLLVTTPAQAREALLHTNKTLIIHSIEGGHHLLWDDTDATFWADQGVALFTLIHLRDKEFGGAAILNQQLGGMINPKGARARAQGRRRGLTEHGKKRILDLHKAGILVDYSHMSPDALEDGFALSAAHGFAPVMTHGRLSSVTDDEFGITDAQLVELYRQGGVFSLGLSALELTKENVAPDAPDHLCWATLEAWAWHHNRVQQVLAAHVATIFNTSSLTADQLTDDQKTRLATGWSSDWNGWVSHSKPVYGARRCRDPKEATLPIDTLGLAHPGLLPQHWRRVSDEGVDMEPMLRSAERFLRLWEDAVDEESEGHAFPH